MSGTSELESIIRLYKSHIDDAPENVIIWLDKDTGEAIVPGLFTPLLKDLQKLVIVPDRWAWLADQTLEYGNFVTNEKSTLKYRARVLIPEGKENKAAAALAGHGRRPDGTLRQYISDWLDRWINAPLRDHSRIVHRLQDVQEQLQEELSKATSSELGVRTMIRFEVGRPSTKHEIKVDIETLRVQPADAKNITLSLGVVVVVKRHRSMEKPPLELPPGSSEQWRDLITDIVSNQFLHHIPLHWYYFDSHRIDAHLLAALNGELHDLGFECVFINVYPRDTIPYRYRSNQLIITAPAEGYATTEPSFQARPEVFLLWGTDNVAKQIQYVFPRNILESEIEFRVRQALAERLSRTSPVSYFSKFDSYRDVYGTEDLGQLAKGHQSVPPVSVVLRQDIKNKLADLNISVGTLEFQQKDPDILAIQQRIQQLPDLAIMLEIDVINVRGVTQRIDAVFHVEGIAPINPLKARREIEAEALKKEI